MMQGALYSAGLLLKEAGVGRFLQEADLAGAVQALPNQPASQSLQQLPCCQVCPL